MITNKVRTLGMGLVAVVAAGGLWFMNRNWESEASIAGEDWIRSKYTAKVSYDGNPGTSPGSAEQAANPNSDDQRLRELFPEVYRNKAKAASPAQNAPAPAH